MNMQTTTLEPNAPMQTIAILGFGNIAHGLCPLLRAWRPEAKIVAFDMAMDPERRAIAEEYGIEAVHARIERHNLKDLAGPYCHRGSLVLNLATSISSLECMEWAQGRGAFYLDTCIDPWEYSDGSLHDSSNTNYAMRQQVVELRERQRSTGKAYTTAVSAHGANPGFVSVLAKQALLAMRDAFEPTLPTPTEREGWARLAEALGIACIQISERDHQKARIERPAGAFYNTWSVDGYVAEALQPAELGWGTHEESGPMAETACRHDFGDRCAVYLPALGVHAKVKSWAPIAGEFIGRLISHNEAMSLSSYLTLHDEDGNLAYRPTAYYAYRPTDMAEESIALIECGDRKAISSTRVLKDELETGVDELGVLLVSNRHPSLWMGSQLSIERARKLAPRNNATSLQVVGSVMAALEWMLDHPAEGIVESEDMDHEFIYEKARPYWEPIAKIFMAWHPRGDLSPQAVWTLDQFLV